MHDPIGQRGEDEVRLARRHAICQRLFGIEPAEADIHQRVGFNDMGCRALDHRDVDACFVKCGADVMGRIVRADHDNLLALVAIRPRVLRGMMLLTPKALAALEIRDVRLAGHAGCKDELFRPQHHFLAVAVDHDRPFLRGFVPFGRLGGGACPVVQLHHLRIEFQPIADLVLWREDRPVFREVDVGQVIVPDGVMQAERLVALAPAVAWPLVPFEDDGGHAQLTKPSAERNAALSAADDHDIGLVFIAERALLMLALLFPGLRANILAMLGAEGAGKAGLFLVALEFGKRRQQRPDKAVLDAHEAIAAPGRRLERDPAFEHAIGLGRFLAGGDAPIGGLCKGELRIKHVAHLIPALDRLDIPGEGDEVAPVAFLGEELGCIVDAAGFERVAKGIKQRLNAGGGGLLEHRFSSCSVMKMGRLLNRPATRTGLTLQVDQNFQMGAGGIE
ncbi:hypothetical protein D9M72_419690 [compost metagenome]